MNEAQRIEKIIHFTVPGIDKATVAQQIARNLQQHQLNKPLDFPRFEIAPPAVGARTLLAFNLQQAFHEFSNVWVTNDAPATGMPILARLRHAAHALVVYYVNHLADRQTRFNAAILRTLGYMNQATCRDEINALHREIAELKARISRLEDER